MFYFIFFWKSAYTTIWTLIWEINLANVVLNDIDAYVSEIKLAYIVFNDIDANDFVYK